MNRVGEFEKVSLGQFREAILGDAKINLGFAVRLLNSSTTE